MWATPSFLLATRLAKIYQGWEAERAPAGPGRRRSPCSLDTRLPRFREGRRQQGLESPLPDPEAPGPGSTVLRDRPHGPPQVTLPLGQKRGHLGTLGGSCCQITRGEGTQGSGVAGICLSSWRPPAGGRQGPQPAPHTSGAPSGHVPSRPTAGGSRAHAGGANHPWSICGDPGHGRRHLPKLLR